MLVLDANIPIRAVRGSRVLFLIEKYAEQEFWAPDTAFQAQIQAILGRRKMPIAPAMVTLGSLGYS
jgi:hypothetical protein